MNTTGADPTPPDQDRPALDVSAVRDLLHDALHELAVINTLAASVALDGSCSPAAQRDLRYMQQQTVALSNMLRTVFLSRLESGPISVRALLDEVAQTTDAACHVTVRVEEGAPRHVLGYGIGLRRIVRNLVDNAASAAGPEGLVEVTAKAGSNGLVIAVDDSGPGFGCGPPGLAALGLHIVGRLIDEIGGSIDVGRSHLGGARVTVFFPGVMLVEAGGEQDGVDNGVDGER
jgi:signal transduction histidine kinase